MKRIIAILLATALFSATAIAVDLSSFSFEELISLRDECQLEMMKRTEWQEVVVPQGIWEVGKQIPAGIWVVKCYDAGRNDISMEECVIFWGVGYPDDGLYWSYDKSIGKAYIYNPENRFYQGQTSEYIIKLEEGYFISIPSTCNKAVFSPYTGIDLGFK